MMEDELANSPPELYNGDGFGEIEESKHGHPLSRQKTDNQPQQQIVPLAKLQAAQVINSVQPVDVVAVAPA